MNKLISKMSLLTYTFFSYICKCFPFLRSSCYFLPFGLIQYQVILQSSADEEIKEQKEVQGKQILIALKRKKKGRNTPKKFKNSDVRII